MFHCLQLLVYSIRYNLKRPMKSFVGIVSKKNTNLSRHEESGRISLLFLVWKNLSR